MFQWAPDMYFIACNEVPNVKLSFRMHAFELTTTKVAMYKQVLQFMSPYHLLTEQS